MGSRKRVRVLLGGACLGLSAVSLWSLLAPVAGGAENTFIAVDRQAYVSDNGPDAYEATGGTYDGKPDPIDIHVGAVPERTTYHSFVHVALEAVPSDADISQLTVKLVPTNDPQRSATENVNPSSAVLDAWPLKTELAANYDPSQPPPYDTSGPEVVGKVDDKDGSWTFDLTRLLPYWKQHGNTGAAIVPDPVAQQAWTIGFDRTLSTAQAVYTFPANNDTSTQVQQPAADANAAPVEAAPPASDSGPGLGVGAPPAAAVPAAPAPAQSQPAAPAQRQPAAAVPAAPGMPAGTVPVWLLALGVSLTAAVALLAQPVSEAFGAAAGLGTGMLAQLRLHPRMFAVAGTMVLWSSTLGVYANTIGKNTLGPGGGIVAGGTQQGAQAGGDQASGEATPAPGATAGTGGGGSGGATATGGGQALTGAAAYLNNPNAPHPPSANLFSASENTIGITNTRIQMCAHAALTFGAAFNIGASDLNVFWQMIDDQGGIWGRKVLQPDGSAGIPFQDDGYQPSKAVTAAQACNDQPGGDFVLLGGIGFDQIPAVRVWAEGHHMPYIHHIATLNGAQGLRYSFSMLPTLEQIGTQYGEYYVGHHAGAKLGIVYRNSSNWDPGRVAFENYLKQAGRFGDIVDEEPVNNNQGDYSTQIARMHNVYHANMVFIYENALAAEQFIQQSSQQNWDPQWLMFPFNLTLNTLAAAGVDTSHMDGAIPWPSYVCHAEGDARFSPYKAELQRFEDAYAHYDKNANLCGDGGDLLFGTWLAWEQTYDLLYQCGPGCTRNNIAGLMMGGYHSTVGANCAVDFRGTDGHHGGGPEDTDRVETVNGSPGWVTTALCLKDLR